MEFNYTPHDWYWIVAGDETKAWSSLEAKYVETYPSGQVTRIASEEELREVLANVGIPTKAPGYVPVSVYMWQAKAALAAINKLEQANAVISGSNNAMLTTAWEYAPYISRKNPAVAAIAQAISLTSKEVDALFIAAEQIKV